MNLRFSHPTRVVVLALLTGILWPVVPAQSAQRSEDPSEQMVRNIAKDLRCAVCQNQSIYDSNADLARDMMVIIREKVRAKEPEADIRRYFLERYGEYIYLKPMKSGKNWILWWTPWLGVLLGGWALWQAIHRWRDRSPPSDPSPPFPEPTQEIRARIQKALDDTPL